MDLANVSAPHGRRLTSPVRVALARQLDAGLSGAWWPRTAWLAKELPELIEALREPLGAITDISVNWSPTESAPDFESVRVGAGAPAAARGWGSKHQHLMVLTGRRARATLLVVPHLTASSIAVMVLRRAAGRPISSADQDTKAFQIADHVVRAACTECGHVS